MGGVSTSHSAVLRNERTESSLPSSFDLHSWQGLTHVLRVGKESLRDPHAYAEFRNLVLQYAQQGGDIELKHQIDAITATFKKSAGTAELPKAEKKKEAPPQKIEIPEEEKKPSMGMRRNTPQFTASSAIRIQPAPPAPVAPKEASHAKSVPVSRNLPAQEEKKAKEPVPAAAPAPAPEAKFKSLDEYKARIAEIKRLVNAHIGNPAALIDTKNTHGRTYMSVLLTALKAAGGNGTEGVDSAMAKLEEAYETLIADGKNLKQSAPVAETPRSTPPPAVKKEVPVPVKAAPPPQQKEESIPPAKKYSVADTFASLTKAEVAPPTPRPLPNPPPMPKAEVEKPSTDETAHAQNKYTLKGLAKAQPESVLKKDTDAVASEVATRQTELGTPQITEALHQLLHEWTLFSGSGLFGIGPGGAEHPLYVKLAPLSMGEVVAGRWEGSNPKTLKTIKQYVDAWRHEQGIAYTINETFEHYLRRVVQRILKRQNS